MQLKYKILLPVLLLVGIAIGIAYKAFTQDQTEQTKRNIPGITEKDIFIKGCVTCHVGKDGEESDYRISTIMKRWSESGYKPELLKKFQAAAPDGVVLKGKHSFKSNSETMVPEQCYKCHGKSMKTAYPMGQIMHIIHFTGEKNDYIAKYNGECTHCHKIDLQTGAWSSINARESDIK